MLLSALRLYRLWGSPSPRFGGYLGFSSKRKAAEAHLVPWLRTHGSVSAPPPGPIYIHGVCIIFSPPEMLLVWSNQEGWSWSRVSYCPQQWWALYIAIQYCSVVGVASYCVGTAVYTVMLINFIVYSPSWEACNYSEDSSQCSQNLATAPCPSQMNKLHVSPCCSFILYIILFYFLPPTIRSSKLFLQVVQLKSCTYISWRHPCQYSTLFILASSVIVLELAVLEYEVCVSIWRYEVAKMAYGCRGSVP
jgi:hypothetical protein